MRAILLSAAALTLAICQISLACGSAPSGCDQALAVHAPIRIDSDADFTPVNGVTGGSGTAVDPWSIAGWDISGALHACCIYVGNTTQPFAIENCRAHNASGNFVSYFYTESGIIFYNVTYGSISGSVAENNGFDGICLYNSTHCDVSGNTVRWNEYGITLMDGSNNNSLDGNSLSENGYYGAGLFGSHYNEVSGNAVSGNAGPGISISESALNTVSLNSVSGSRIGLELWDSCNNTVSGNSLLDNRDGIVADMSHGNRLLRNNVSDNRQNGIILSSSTGNAIWQNRLANNTMAQAMDGSGGNAWDGGYPAGGNWWGDYVGQDADRDGFGDMPYFGIWGGMGARDRHPLMREWFEDCEAPAADAGPDATVGEGSAVQFNGSASRDNVGIVNYTWQFYVQGSAVRLHGVSAAHNFTVPGVYTVILEARDSAGNAGSDATVVTVLDTTRPTADAGEDIEALVFAEIMLNGTASHDSSGIANYTWNYTENGTAVLLYGPMPATSFRTTGNCTVTLTVRDAAGNSGTDTVTVRVTAPAQPPEPQEEANETATEPEPDRGNSWAAPTAVGIMIAVCAACAFFLMRRKKSS